jgi:hypothetical protein
VCLASFLKSSPHPCTGLPPVLSRIHSHPVVGSDNAAGRPISDGHVGCYCPRQHCHSIGSRPFGEGGAQCSSPGMDGTEGNLFDAAATIGHSAPMWMPLSDPRHPQVLMPLIHSITGPRPWIIVEMKILLLGPNVFFCMPNRTTCILLLSVLVSKIPKTMIQTLLSVG